MSNSSLISYTQISPNKTVPRNHAIDTITIHCFVGQVTVERMGKSFGSKASGTSCNYGIGFDGRIGMYVEEKDRSWCSSNRANDHRAITIECASDSKPPYAINGKVYSALVRLCTDICRRNNIKELKWKADKSLIGNVEEQNMTVHRWFANKECPGEYIYQRLGNIASEVNTLLGLNAPIFNPSSNEQKTDDIKDEPVKEEPVKENVQESFSYDLKTFISDIQKAFGATIDGIAGPETLRRTLTLSVNKNRRHPAVKHVQKRLKTLGYIEVGSVDGIAGPRFTQAVKHFQKDNECVSDGIITAKNKTWRKLLKME